MSPRIILSRCTGAILVAFAAGSVVAAAEPSLRLLELPERLVLPLPEGANQLLTARVAGGTAKSVWLAAGENATQRLPLAPVGDGEYEINLADPEIAGILRDAGDRRQFRVFAELTDGTLIESTGVNFAVRPAARPSAQCYVYLQGRPDDGVEVESGELWLDAAEVRLAELRFDADAIPSAARAEAGDRDWPLEPGASEGLFQIEITDEIRAIWQQEGELRIAYRDEPEWKIAAVLQARPAGLDLEATAVPFTLFQRDSEIVPGSRGYLRVFLGDITAGEVMLTLQAEDGLALIDKVSVREGDSPEFELNGQRYFLHVKRLANVLIGDDWAELEVHSISPSSLSQIERLLERIAKADVIFVREGKEYTGREAADHLRRKLQAAGPRIESAEEFIEHIASRSSISGKPYLIKLSDGTTVEARPWLEEQLALIAAEPHPPTEPPQPAVQPNSESPEPAIEPED